MKIAVDKVVEIDYVLTVDGVIVDQSEEGHPLPYLHGAQNIIVGLEKSLEGKQVGDSFSVTVSPEEGYGEYDADNIQQLSRADFEDDIEVGETYYAENADGSVIPFRVTSLEDDEVSVDFNSDLAGKTLHFQVTVRTIRDATPEELQHGHVHGEDMDEEDEE